MFDSDEMAIRRQIIASPNDDAPRLVFADWLEERSSPDNRNKEWADFIRLQCARPNFVLHFGKVYNGSYWSWRSDVSLAKSIPVGKKYIQGAREAAFHAIRHISNPIDFEGIKIRINRGFPAFLGFPPAATHLVAPIIVENPVCYAKLDGASPSLHADLSYSWTSSEAADHNIDSFRGQIAKSIFDFLDGHKNAANYGLNYKFYFSPEKAQAALSRAIIQWSRAS